MKLRLRENSIRLRLLQTEIRQLRETGIVSEKIIFGASPAESLTYSLRISGEAKQIFAQFSGNQIEIYLPLNAAENWINSDEVSLNQTQTIDDASQLKILIEKDFVCVDRPTDEDNRDAFPHPKMAKAR